MRNENSSRRLYARLMVITLVLVRCTGTSTWVDNNLTGIALMPDGKPAAGATVTVRTGELVVSRLGTPAYRQIAFAVADSQGRFQLLLEDPPDFYLEIRQASVSMPAGDAFPAVFFGAYPGGHSAVTRLGVLRLSPSGIFTGLVKTEPYSAPVWVGLRGTDNFYLAAPAPVPGGAPFRLTEICPGSRTLVIVDARPNVGPHDSLAVLDSVTNAAAVQERTVDLGVVPVSF